MWKASGWLSGRPGRPLCVRLSGRDGAPGNPAPLRNPSADGHLQHQQAGIGGVGDQDRRGAVGAVELHGGAGDFADDLREVANSDDDVRLPGCLGGNGVVGGIGLGQPSGAVAAELPRSVGGSGMGLPPLALVFRIETLCAE